MRIKYIKPPRNTKTWFVYAFLHSSLAIQNIQMRIPTCILKYEST